MEDLNTEPRWYVMRDLKRSNASVRAYDMLKEAGMKVYTPLATVIEKQGNVKRRVERPVIPDLLFVYSSRADLDRFVDVTPTLQYRYMKGAAYKTPMVVPDRQMTEFVNFTSQGSNVKYYSPEEVTPAMLGKRARIVGGDFEGIEGYLLSIRGSHQKRLVINIDGLIGASAVIENDFIELI